MEDPSPNSDHEHPKTFKTPALSVSFTENKLMNSQFGCSPREKALQPALKKLGISNEEMVEEGNRLFNHTSSSSGNTRSNDEVPINGGDMEEEEDMRKVERLTGYSSDQIKRTKAINLLGVDEEVVDEERSMRLSLIGDDHHEEMVDGGSSMKCPSLIVQEEEKEIIINHHHHNMVGDEGGGRMKRLFRRRNTISSPISSTNLPSHDHPPSPLKRLSTIFSPSSHNQPSSHHDHLPSSSTIMSYQELLQLYHSEKVINQGLREEMRRMKTEVEEMRQIMMNESKMVDCERENDSKMGDCEMKKLEIKEEEQTEL